MKVSWEADDIKPGRVVGKPDRIERWIIGYFAEIGDDRNLISDRRYTLISLSDGMVQPAMTKDAMAAQLNGSGEIPVEFFERPKMPNRANGPLARAASQTPERRSEIARHAANTRHHGN